MEHKSILIMTTLCVISFIVEGQNRGLVNHLNLQLIATGSSVKCDGSSNEVRLIAPSSVVAGEDLYAKCVTDGDQQPRVVALNHDCKSKVKYLNDNQQNVNCGQLDFVVRNASKSCTFQCFICGLHERGTVSVVGQYNDVDEKQCIVYNLYRCKDNFISNKYNYQ